MANYTTSELTSERRGKGGVRLGIQKVALSELALHVNYTFFLGRGGMFRVDKPSAEGLGFTQTGNYAGIKRPTSLFFLSLRG